MDYEFREVVFTIKELAREIIAACDAYKSRKINSTDLRKYMFYYANHYPDKLFNGPDINPTIKTLIGKKRASVLNEMLSGYQVTIFKGI